MSTYKINLKEQTATSINGITFQLTEGRRLIERPLPTQSGH